MTKKSLSEQIGDERTSIAQEIAYGLMHDMQTHIVNTRNAAELIKYEASASNEVNKERLLMLCEDILRSASHCLSVIEALPRLSSSSDRTAPVEPMTIGDLKDLVGECTRLLPSISQPIEICSTGERLMTFDLERDTLKYMILNLIINAAQNSTPNSRIKIMIEVIGAHLRISIGNFALIDAVKNIDQWEKPGYSESKNKSGQGLTIVAHAADLLGGKLEIRSFSKSDPNTAWVDCSFILAGT